MIAVLKNLLKLNLETGPYITGSYMTYLLEYKYRTPNWKPNDIDIVCRTEDQIESVDQILKKLDPNRTIDRMWGITYYYWTINDYQIQGIVHDVSAKERIDWVDYTITAIATDGANTIQDDNTENDIVNKILRRRPNHVFGGKSFQLKRYQKYTERGFQDIDNKIYNEVSQWQQS